MRIRVILLIYPAVSSIANETHGLATNCPAIENPQCHGQTSGLPDHCGYFIKVISIISLMKICFSFLKKAFEAMRHYE
ncbi:MAG: hypothetical protein SVZ03_03325 [Spirochaetota bacterium]|nr:hypothetical protein [Spirochaetota bacterium]